MIVQSGTDFYELILPRHYKYFTLAYFFATQVFPSASSLKGIFYY